SGVKKLGVLQRSAPWKRFEPYVVLPSASKKRFLNCFQMGFLMCFQHLWKRRQKRFNLPRMLGVRRRDPPLAIRMTTRTNSRDVGAVIVRDRAEATTREPTSIMIHLQRNDRPQYLRGNDAQRAPLCFPLLFPQGDLGWGQ